MQSLSYCHVNKIFISIIAKLWLFYLPAGHALPGDPGKGRTLRCHFSCVALQTLPLPSLPHSHQLLLHLPPLACKWGSGCLPGDPRGEGSLTKAAGEQLLIPHLKAVASPGKELHSPRSSLQMPNLPAFVSFALGTISQVIR